LENSKEPILVMRPSLPDYEEFVELASVIWENRTLSNRGPLLVRLEEALKEYLNVPYVSVVSSGTVACMLALRHLGMEGDVITTPFSYLATTHAIAWAGGRPVFADIDPGTLNINSAEIEKQITSDTKGILAVHCYGNPCDTEALANLAARYNLPLVYDGAHCFGSVHNERSLLAFGDLSVLSLHATKVFGTLEGGAVISHDADTKASIDRLANYGIVDEESVESLGLNGKMGELNAAFGLALLRKMTKEIEMRRIVAERYWSALETVRGIKCVCSPKQLGRNYYAFPILVNSDYPVDRDTLYHRLKADKIHARRYFFPLVSDLPMYRNAPGADADNLPIASEIARQVLCLPMYPDLEQSEQERILQHLLWN
jgi:dTDP-4-amino-4,6-dideoxygalactose transaminase